MKINLFFLLALFMMGSSVTSYADSFEPLPHCYKPTKPLWLATSYYKTRYNRDVEEYQRCMKSFIVAQENAVKIHTQAAQNALKTWNEFVQSK
ncbi:MAG: hypothetical protein OQL19_09065 [Gammaproteobacteria bacterium]|nr:hypothetical protein [Gammaproteobacteria bacterium]